MGKINKLTPEQEASLPRFVEYGLKHGLSTERVDRPKAEAAVRAHYKALGREEPRLIVWLDSPHQGAIGAAILAGAKFSGAQVWDQVGDQVWAQVWDQVWAQVWDQVRAQVGDQVWDQVGDQVRAQVGDQVWDQVRAQVGDQVWDQVRAQVWAQVGDQVWDQVRAQVWDQVGDQVYHAAYGAQDMGWVAWFTAMRAIGVKLINTAETIAAVSEQVGWWWPFERAVILTERPTVIRFDGEKRLHCETGPAIEYADGFRVYAWRGLRIPGKWITDGPPPAADIMRLENTEQRRIACEMRGWHNILPELGAKLIDRHANPQIGELWEAHLPDNGPERFLKVVCGTGRTFAMPVGPAFKTALEANAATYGVAPQILENIQFRT